MNNLTENQQTIINQITNEFKKINEEYKVHKGGLIDLSDIVKELNEDKIRRSEIEVQNNINKNIFIENVRKDIQRINDDLVKYGLIAFQKYESTIRIATQKEFNKLGNSNVQYYLDIRCIQNAETIYFKSKISNISKNESSYYYQSFAGEYKSLEDLTINPSFTNHMRELIVKQNQ